MQIQDCIIRGVKRGVARKLLYSKDLLKIKPEYLLTVAVADAVAEGFDGVNGIDVEVKLEEETGRITRDLVPYPVGSKEWIGAPRHRVKRKGKIDIFINTNKTCWLIEVKGMNPSSRGIQADIERIEELLLANPGHNRCGGGYVAFPTSEERVSFLERKFCGSSRKNGICCEVMSERMETGEAPEDGIPVVFVNCMILRR